MMLQKKNRITNVSRIHPLGDRACSEFHGNHISVWTRVVDRQTDITIPRAMLLAWLNNLERELQEKRKANAKGTIVAFLKADISIVNAWMPS